MDMDERLRKTLIVFIFLLNYTLVASNLRIGVLINFLGSTTISLILNVIPGYLYYRYERDT